MSDFENRKLAIDPKQSFIVQAPAGSGKTELLIQRYLTLLTRVNDPAEVLVMTFTNKAVDELMERVVSALKLSAEAKAKSEHQRQTQRLAQAVMKKSNALGWHLLNNPNRLNILTIDALSNQILSQQSSEHTDYEILTADWQRQNYYEQAVLAVFELSSDVKYRSAIVNVLSYFDNNAEKTVQLMVNMLKKRDQWLRHVSGQKNTLDQAKIEQSLKAIVDENIASLKQNIVFDAQFFQHLENAGIELNEQNQDFDFWQQIHKLCLTNDGTRRARIDINNGGIQPEFKTEKAHILSVIETLSDEQVSQLASVKSLPSDNYLPQDWHILHDITQLLRLCAAQLDVLFGNAHKTDYIDVNMKVSALLGELGSPSDVALFLAERTHHILFDEFQDIANTQYELLLKLATTWQGDVNKTLFLVGDPMQSIYGFREAQVGLFLSVAEHGMAEFTLQHLQLSHNFRSNKMLVDVNNQLFKRILPTENDAYLGQVAFFASEAFDKSDDKKNTQTPQNVCHWHVFEKDNESGVLSQETQKICHIVKQLEQQYPEDDIAVLARSRKHLTAIMAGLSHHNIAFEAQAVTTLDKHFVVQDLLMLVKVFDDVEDKLAWLSLLRSPWCGLSLADLLLVADNSDGFWQHLQEFDKTTLSADGQKRFQHLYTALCPLIEAQGHFSLTHLLNVATHRLSMADYLSPLEQNIKYLFMNQLDVLIKQELFSVENLAKALSILYAPSVSANVKLMTMHGAKGLEFDHVILPNLNARTGSDSADVVLFYEDADRRFFASATKSTSQKSANAVYGYIQQLQTQKTRFEIMRLLYVAMTRAKKTQHLLATADRDKKKGALKATKNTFFSFLLNAQQQYFGDLSTATLAEETEFEIPNEHNPNVMKRIDERTLQTLPNIEMTETDEVLGDLIENDERLIGTLIHRYFEFHHSPTKEQLRFDLRQMGLFNEVDKLQQTLSAMFERLATDEQAKWLFQKRPSTEVEASFGYLNQQGEAKEIIVDRLFVEQDKLWLIDFKTSTPSKNENLDDFAERMRQTHQQQLALYARVLTKVYQLPVQKALYCPMVPILIELSR